MGSLSCVCVCVCVCVFMCMLSHVQLFATPWTLTHRLLCPWNFLGKNARAGCHFLLQRIFPTQGTCISCLLHWWADSLPLHHVGGKCNHHFSSVAKSCPTLCDPMVCSMPGFPVHSILPEPTQTHVHWVSDAIQPSHPLSPPSPLAPNPSQHHGLFQ